MKQVVYVDILIIVNVFINYFLLLLSSAITKSDAKRWRILLGACVGGVYSLVVFLPELNLAINIIMRIIAGAIIIFITFGYKTFQRFIKLFLYFLAITFVFAGMMIAIWFIFKPNGMLMKNSAVYFSISLPVFIATTTVCYIISKLVIKFFMRNKVQPHIYDFILCSNGKEIKGRAMLDTGNNLSESFSGYPVVICSLKKLRDILPAETEGFFSGDISKSENIKDESWKKKIRVISFSAVKGGGLLPSFRPEKLTLIHGKEKTETDKVFVAVTDMAKYLNESYEMLLNPNIF